MSKSIANYKCTQCDKKTSKWFGCCPECSSWNSVTEFRESSHKNSNFYATSTSIKNQYAKMKLLDEVSTKEKRRMLSGIEEWDRVTGGGIVEGAFMILTGDPGIGKSTLLLQVASKLSQKHKLFYFSSEESLEQIKLRAERIGCVSKELLFSDEADIDRIIATAEKEKPSIIIIDSIQNCYNSRASTLPGSIGQLKESTFKFMRLAKENRIAVLLSGHITKDGTMAGPKTLEHMVDTVLYLQGEDKWQTRILRTIKNRFGTTNEVGFFQMKENGLNQVPNISKEFVTTISDTPGSALVSYTEGSRSFILELQALTIKSKFGIPQRVITGVEQKQVILIAAILEKYLGLKFSGQDIFFKVSGGLKIKGNASDLGIAIALLSSFFKTSIGKTLALGEISLTGQIKPVNHADVHISEAKKFGIDSILVSKNQKYKKTNCLLKKFGTVKELIELFN